MDGLKKLNDFLFPGAKTYERVGTGKALALGFQHAFAMSCATILVPLLTGLDVGVALLAAGLFWPEVFWFCYAMVMGFVVLILGFHFYYEHKL